MLMSTDTFSYTVELTLEEFTKQNVILCLNEQGQKTILIKNSDQNTRKTTSTTKYLEIKKNLTIELSGTRYYVHSISCTDSSEWINKNFMIIHDYLFKKLDEPIDDQTFAEILISIEELFGKGSVLTTELQFGIIGEILTLYYLYNHGVDNAFNYFHKNPRSRFDIEFNEKLKLEVKTTGKDTRVHRFRHTQLIDQNLDIYISSCLLVVLENGTSIFQLLTDSIILANDPEYTFNVSKIINKYKLSTDNCGIHFDFPSSLGSIKIYNSKDVPKLTEEIPPGVKEVSYEIEFSAAVEISVETLILNINKETGK